MPQTDDQVIVSALAVFGLSEVFAQSELDASYRRVALRCHPDKGGRRDLFETVRECYRVLHDHARSTGMWARGDVQAAYGEALGSRELAGNASAAPRLAAASGSAFNVAEFNRRYEEGRSRNEERDAGYAGWLSEAAKEFSEPTKPVINPKSGRGAFNSAFERHTPGLDSQSGAIVLRPDYMSAGGIGGALFDDTEEVGDYTTEVGGGVFGADCRLAHGNQRLASTAWARQEVRIDRGSISRLSAERSSTDWSQVAAAAAAAERGDLLAPGIRQAISELTSRRDFG